MLTNAQIKFYSSLKLKKNRLKEKLFLIEGKRIVHEGLKTDYKFDCVLATNNFTAENSNIINIINRKNIELHILKSGEFNKISETKSAQGIIGVGKIEAKSDLSEIGSKLIIAANEINDPGNLGTILRTAEWFGIKDIVISSNSADVFSGKVIRSSMGAIFYLNLYTGLEAAEALKQLKKSKYQIITADLGGVNLFASSFDSNKKYAIVISNEAHGPSLEIINLSDTIITIPKFGNIESLNAANSCGIILSEIVKSIS